MMQKIKNDNRVNAKENACDLSLIYLYMNYLLKHKRISGDLECYGLYNHSLTHHSISRNSLHIFIIIKFVQNIGSYPVCSHM